MSISETTSLMLWKFFLSFRLQVLIDSRSSASNNSPINQPETCVSFRHARFLPFLHINATIVRLVKVEFPSNQQPMRHIQVKLELKTIKCWICDNIFQTLHAHLNILHERSSRQIKLMICTSVRVLKGIYSQSSFNQVSKNCFGTHLGRKKMSSKPFFELF